VSSIWGADEIRRQKITARSCRWKCRSRKCLVGCRAGLFAQTRHAVSTDTQAFASRCRAHQVCIVDWRRRDGPNVTPAVTKLSCNNDCAPLDFAQGHVRIVVGSRHFRVDFHPPWTNWRTVQDSHHNTEKYRRVIGYLIKRWSRPRCSVKSSWRL
jgi:hypothetical protein